MKRAFLIAANIFCAVVAFSTAAQPVPPADTVKFLLPPTAGQPVVIQLQTPQPACFYSQPSSVKLSGDTVDVELNVPVPCPGDAPLDTFVFNLGTVPEGFYNLVIDSCILSSPPACGVIINVPFVVSAVAAAPVPVPAVTPLGLVMLALLTLGLGALGNRGVGHHG